MSSTRQSLSRTPPIVPSGHGLTTPRDQCPRRRASGRTARATPATLCARGCNLGDPGCNPICTRLQPYVSQASRETARASRRTARLRLPWRPGPRRRAKRCAVAAPAGTASTPSARAPNMHRKHTTLRALHRACTAPHVYRTAQVRRGRFGWQSPSFVSRRDSPLLMR